jgi:hypothetical protein
LLQKYNYQTTIYNKNNFILQIKCLECNGSGIFDCGIKEENNICVSCKGAGKQYIGTI